MGEYEGEFISCENGVLSIREMPGYELMEWRVSPSFHRIAAKIEQVLPGEKVIVSVEFNDYTVTDITIPELDLRALLERIKSLESRMEELENE